MLYKNKQNYQTTFMDSWIYIAIDNTQKYFITPWIAATNIIKHKISEPTIEKDIII